MCTPRVRYLLVRVYVFISTRGTRGISLQHCCSVRRFVSINSSSINRVDRFRMELDKESGNTASIHKYVCTIIGFLCLRRLSCLILYYIMLYYIILYYIILSHLILYSVLSCLILSHLISSYLILSCLASSYLVLSRLTLSRLVLSCFFSSCLVGSIILILIIVISTPD